jgi:tetratricopeptide (TPR) repeat protein/transglutaminase-like putative cysteine protease
MAVHTLNMTLKSRTLFYFLFLAAGAFAVRAQAPSGAAAPKPDFSKEAAVAEQLTLKASFENDGTSVVEQSLRVRIQSDSGVQRYGLLTFTYQGATQSVEFDYVRVRKQDGSLVVTSPDNIQDMDAGITREAPFYSDLREKHVAVKGLSVGDTLEYLVRWRSTKSLAPGQFWYSYNFEHDAIVLDEELQISVPRERAVKVKSPSVTAAVTEQGGRRIYNWKSSNLADHSKDNETRKTLDANLGLLPMPDVQVSSFQSWDEVGKWYQGLQQERIQPSPAISDKAAELTKGAVDPSAQLHSIYNFVSLKFRYIGVAFGIGRYQPHSADDVLGNGFGDCKDKHTLLASLLQASGKTAYPALISTTHKLDPDVPSPAQFDHVISAVPQGDGLQWLDTTAEVAPFGYLMPEIRGKQALVMQVGKPAILMTTPANPPEPNNLSFQIDGKLSDDGTLDAKMEHTSRGDSEMVLRAVFRQVPQAKWNDLVQQLSYTLGFAGTVSNADASSPENTAAPFHFSYTYNRKEYPDWKSHQITVPGLPFIVPQVKEDDAHAKDPIWLGPMQRLTSDTRMEMPGGYFPELPSDVVLIRDFAEYRSTYKLEGRVLVSHREMQTKLSQVPDAQREDYKKFAKDLGEDVNRFIVFSRSTAQGPAGAQNSMMESLTAVRKLPDSSNPAVQKLETQAYEAMGPNPNGALETLKDAVAADPKFTRGWDLLGSMYMALSQKEPALDAFRKAIDSDPKQSVSYRLLAFALMSLHRNDDAIQVWKSLLQVAPDDHAGISNLGNLLFTQKRYAEAIPLLESEVAFNATPGNMTALGSAYLKSGDVDQGTKTLLSALKMDSNPSTLNNVSYELADAKAMLPEALDYAQRAVREQEETTQKIDLSKIAAEDLPKIRSLISYWDTLGWVYFRMGRPADAEKYLRAAWSVSQMGVVGDHLGQVYEQQQRKAEAIHMYRLAIRASSMNGGAAQDEIQAHLSRLVPGASLSTGFDLHRGDASGDELSAVRSIKLARIPKGSGSGEVFLLFDSGSKVTDVKFISGADTLADAPKAIQAAVFPIQMPEGSRARIVRRAILSCSQITGCTLVLFNPDTVNSVN